MAQQNESVKKGDFLTLKTDPSKVVIFEAMAGVFGGVDTFTIMYDLPWQINGEMAYTPIDIVKFPFNNFRHSTEEEKALMIKEMEKLGKRYNPETFKIEDMTKEESVKKLEVGKDYVNVHDNDVVVIDRVSDILNKGFERREYKNYMSCSDTSNWREATESEVIEAFNKHLIHRYGKDWMEMEIKERHPDSSLDINDGSGDVEILKYVEGWAVYNKNGLLYYKGIWVERLEEEPKIHIKEAIKGNTAIHCATEQEAKRILGMAHKLGHTWLSGELYIGNTRWNIYKSTTCYYLFDGSYSDCDYFKNRNYTIVPSTQIADLDVTISTGWSPAPEDIDAMNKKAIEKLPIDKVTTENLDIALRIVGIQLDVNIIDRVIDLVELIENKGDDVTIKDIISLQQTWSRHSEAFH